MKYKLQCIKCKQAYDTDDPEPYYCETCNVERLKIAKEIDAKVANKPKRSIKSDLQVYDSLPKFRGFVNAKDLGISLSDN